MTIPRYVIASFAIVLLLVCPVVAANPPRDEASLHDLVTRLDELLRRVERLEKRISRIERLIFPVTGNPDKHGVLRDATGRPIGIWGIDAPPELNRR